MFDYESADESLQNAEENYKATVFYPLVDNMLGSLERRFNQLSTHNETWGFLYNIRVLPEKEQRLKFCKNLELTLCKDKINKSDSDIDGAQLSDELKEIQPSIAHKTSASPLEVLQHINKSQTHGLFPNIWIALRVLLTIPITIASGERSFSKLKLIKTYLRSTMAEERLSSLAILSIENDVSSNLDYKNAIASFAAMKSRRVNFT